MLKMKQKGMVNNGLILVIVGQDSVYNLKKR